MRALSSSRVMGRSAVSRWRATVRTAATLEAVGVIGASVVVFLGLWQVASTRWVVSVLFPPPLRTLEALLAMLR